jgi:hypothetical protein
MIIKASQRSGGKQLGLHLLKTEENEHVEIHEVSGFLSQNLMGAMSEAYAMARGTKCQKYLFSVSLSPPQNESVQVEVFEKAISDIEDRLGLKGQPRAVVFHEKEGRRHCHVVWSRIDAENMIALKLPYFKTKLQEVSKQLFLENGWGIPKGFLDKGLRDPRTFSLAEWQQAKRMGINPKDIKEAAQSCWSRSDGLKSFARAMEEKGLFIAKGDRRGHVAVSVEGEVFALSRLLDVKAKDVAAKLGKDDQLKSVAETKAFLSKEISAKLKPVIADAKRIAANHLRPLYEQREAMKHLHQAERQRLDAGQRQRHELETKERANRIRKGFMGIWDRLTGEYAKARKQNEMEAFFALNRDRKQRHDLIQAQLKDRQALQAKIMDVRTKQTKMILNLFQHAAHYRHLENGGQAGRDNPRTPETPRKRDKGLELG